MRNKYLKFKKCDDGHYVVMAGKIALGTIEPRGQLFTKRVVWRESISPFEGAAEWTSECLQQLAEKLDSLEGVTNKDMRKLLNRLSAESKKSLPSSEYMSIVHSIATEYEKLQ